MLKHENSEKKEQKGIISFELDKQGKNKEKNNSKKKKEGEKEKNIKKMRTSEKFENILEKIKISKSDEISLIIFNINKNSKKI